MTTQGGSGFCRITVATTDTRVDLAVPSAVPLAALLPSVLGRIGVDRMGGGWVLRTVDGIALDTGRTLAASAVVDGSILLLGRASEVVLPPVRDDLADVIGSASQGTPWSRCHTRLAAAAITILANLTAVAAMAIDARSSWLPSAVAAAGFTLAAAAVSRAGGDAGMASVAAGLAATWAALAAAESLGGGWRGGQVLAAAAAALLVATLAAGLAGTIEVAAGIGGFVVLAALGALVETAGADTVTEVASVTGAVSLAATTVLPSLALRWAGVPRPQLNPVVGDANGGAGPIDVERTEEQVRQARRILTALLTGCLAMTTVSIWTLGANHDPSARALAAVLLGLVMLSGRHYRNRSLVTVPVVGGALGLTGLAVIGVGVALDRNGATAVIAVAGAVAVVGAVIGLRPASRGGHSTIFLRWVGAAETTLLVAVVPLVLAVWGVYRTLLDLTD